MTEDVRVALVTGPDSATLARICRSLVEERLIACANVVEGVASIYRWEGAVEEASEALAILKTTAGCLAALDSRFRELHPYDVPEFIVLPVDAGSEGYLRWVDESTRTG